MYTFIMLCITIGRLIAEFARKDRAQKYAMQRLPAYVERQEALDKARQERRNILQAPKMPQK